MKQVRRGVFETNSSSTHTLTLCTKDEYDKLEKAELFISEYDNKLLTLDEVRKELKDYINESMSDEDLVECIKELDFRGCGIMTLNDYLDNDYLECYVENYTTPGGEDVVAFGLYGHD